MADDAELGSDLEMMFTEAAIEANRKPLVKMIPNGKCRNCETLLDNPQALFCDTTCEQEWRWFVKRSNLQTYEGAV